MSDPIVYIYAQYFRSKNNHFRIEFIFFPIQVMHRLMQFGSMIIDRRLTTIQAWKCNGLNRYIDVGERPSLIGAIIVDLSKSNRFMFIRKTIRLQSNCWFAFSSTTTTHQSWLRFEFDEFCMARLTRFAFISNLHIRCYLVGPNSRRVYSRCNWCWCCIRSERGNISKLCRIVEC
jgi:hypothetical protein